MNANDAENPDQSEVVGNVNDENLTGIAFCYLISQNGLLTPYMLITDNML